ncbi:DNA-protecting protein DprA [Bifidobacterium sp. ESL0769]|uniref:DNA-processing protein DprA n=1 Tax=Bifidobacterium sp. ESL0769 TaxID=2983229 RepID=UPI0023F80E3B|nr:DNA-processing protein DprA [Bifidobacterium sp. ESL0769]WEV68038.1 DNA-protecting protein DprA [Bifidobacterium sp. ESL0769]
MSDSTAIPSTTPPPSIDEDTLARAILTFCIDSADALLFATIKGAGDAITALSLIADEKDGTRNRNRLDEVFATGTAKWGRKVNARGMGSFHHGLERWRERLHQLPSSDKTALKDFFTVNGSQWIIGPTSPYWPAQLDDLSIRKDWASPLCLWGIGNPAALVSCPQPLAVVGSRGADDYGRYVARTVAKKAAEQGHLVVSGGAFGIDAAAHWGALDAMSGLGENESGRTVAVFAGGLNHIGPERNTPLFDRIKTYGGALISELCPNTIPEARRFLLRNRIIAALASTVVVAQARSRSGALNTANWAAELGREVYAAPGNINVPGNTGCNWLIRDHRAIILTSVNSVNEICHQGHAPKVLHIDEPTITPTNNETDENQAAKPISRLSTSTRKENHGFIDQPQRQPDDSNTNRTGAALQVPLPSSTETSRSGQGNAAMGQSSSGQHISQSPASKTKPTVVQQEVLTAIRRCRRQGNAATHEAILTMLNTPRPTGKRQSSMQNPANTTTQEATSWSISKLESELGEMELRGLIALKSGTVQIVINNRRKADNP